MSVLTVPSLPRRMADFRRELHAPLLVALAYYLGAEAAFVVGTLSDKVFAPFWPPNVVLFCALLLTPTGHWWRYLLAAFPAHLAAELGVGMHMPQLLIAFATNGLVAGLSAAALRRAVGGPQWFGSLRNAGLYILIVAVAGPAVVALGGAFVPVLGGGSLQHYWTHYMQWFMANAVGSLALGPIALLLLGEQRRWPLASVSTRELAEALILATALMAVCAIAFEASVASVQTGFLPAVIYTPLPFVLYAAVRFGAKGASGAILLVTVVLIWRTLKGPSLFLAPDMETSMFAIQAFLLGLSAPVLMLGASIDETRQAERAVREREERMIFAAYSADACLWRIDYQSDQLWITAYGREMLGFGQHEKINRHAMIEAIHPDDRQQAIQSMQAAIAGNKRTDAEFRIVRRDGEIRWVRCRARAHGYYRGAPAQISGTLADVTDRKAAETELAQQRQEVTHLTRVSMLGELSGGIAHELTQPLAAILANAEAARILLERQPPDLKEIGEALDDIIYEDNRAGEVIHRLRGLLRKSEASFEPTDINGIVNSTVQLMHNELVARRIKISATLAMELPPVSGDPIQLQQVLLNLLLNAIEAMKDVVPSRRIITVTTKVTEGDEIRIEISDHGPGLTPEQREHLFQPFYTTKERGLGLGLSLSSAIAELHRGTLQLDNNTNGGATATLILPSKSAAEALKC